MVIYYNVFTTKVLKIVSKKRSKDRKVVLLATRRASGTEKVKSKALTDDDISPEDFGSEMRQKIIAD